MGGCLELTGKDEVWGFGVENTDRRNAQMRRGGWVQVGFLISNGGVDVSQVPRWAAELKID